jgi:hypothetical protein
MRTAAGQGSVSRDDRAETFGRPQLLTQPGSADISVADAIGDTLPEAEWDSLDSQEKAVSVSRPSGAMRITN